MKNKYFAFFVPPSPIPYYIIRARIAKKMFGISSMPVLIVQTSQQKDKPDILENSQSLRSKASAIVVQFFDKQKRKK